jgi:hypothetical protein
MMLGWNAQHQVQGMCMMQDFFETRLLSMDTDFRVLSAGHLGKLPGIDIAQVRKRFCWRTLQAFLLY